jgi:hypothetical protein
LTSVSVQTVAIVEHVDDGSAALSNNNSDSRAAAASDSESTVLLQYSTTSAAANDDDKDEMIVVSKETMTSAESPHKMANGSATALENGTAHGAATGAAQGEDELDSAGATNAHLPREVQVVSAVSGKKMSIAEARAEFFKSSA